MFRLHPFHCYIQGLQLGLAVGISGRRIWWPWKILDVLTLVRNLRTWEWR